MEIFSQLMLFVGMILMSSHVFAKPIIVYAPFIPGWANEGPQHGFAVEVLQQVMGEKSKQLDLRVLPFGRAIQSFHSDNTACFLGGDAVIHQTLGGDSKLITSLPFMNVRVVALTAKSRPKVESIQQLDQQILGSITGHDIRSYPQLKKIHFAQTVSKDLDRLMRLIALGRIDAIVDFMPSLSPSLDLVHWSESFSIFEFGDSLVCQEGKEQLAIVEWFNQNLRSFTKEDTYHHLTRKYLHGQLNPPVYD